MKAHTTVRHKNFAIGLATRYFITHQEIKENKNAIRKALLWFILSCISAQHERTICERKKNKATKSGDALKMIFLQTEIKMQRLLLSIFSLLSLLIISADFAQAEDKEKEKKSHIALLTEPKEIDAIKILLKEHKKLRNIYNKCLRDPKSRSMCMCEHTGDYQTYTKTLNDISAKGDVLKSRIIHYQESGKKIAIETRGFFEIQKLFGKYCAQDINEGFFPVKESDQPDLKVTGEGEVKEIHTLFLYSHKIDAATEGCKKEDGASRECICKYMESYKKLNKRSQMLTQKHPDWSGRWLQYVWNGESHKFSLSYKNRVFTAIQKYCE